MLLSYYLNAFLYGFYVLLCVTLSDLPAIISSNYDTKTIVEKSYYYTIYLGTWFFFRNIIFLYISFHMISHLLKYIDHMSFDNFIVSYLIIFCNLGILSFNIYSSYKHYEKKI